MKGFNAILGLSLAGVIFALTYISYMIGLVMVLRRMNRLTWHAFVPLLNYYAQVRAVNAPPRWYFLAFVPYLGAVYSGSVAIRLGAVFRRGPAFSLGWLTIGAPIGMFIIARSSEPLDEKLLHAKLELFDVGAIKRDIKDRKIKDSDSIKPLS